MSIFIGNADGLDEPVMCKDIKWIKMIAVKIKGNRKWMEKNRFNVGLLTENPPQIHWTISLPNKGITDTKLVITEVPQKDIWPQGRTYPTNAVIIRSKKIVIPDIHVSFNLNELNDKFFKMWR